jgi:hypothetical protein
MGRSCEKSIGRVAGRRGKSQSKRGAEILGRRLRFEPLEERRLLTSVVGTLLIANVGGTTPYIEADQLAYSNNGGNVAPVTGNAYTFATVQGSGVLVGGIALNPTDGNLFVHTFSGGVQEFNGATGALVTNFVAPNPSYGTSGGGIAFGPDGNLYVAFSSAVMVFSPTGASLGTFVRGLSDAVGLIFGPNGNLYVANDFEASDSQGPYPQGEILEYQGPNGTSPGTLVASVTRFTPVSFTSTQQQVSGALAFGPSDDSNVAGCLFVGCFGDGKHGWVEELSDDNVNGQDTRSTSAAPPPTITRSPRSRAP